MPRTPLLLVTLSILLVVSARSEQLPKPPESAWDVLMKSSPSIAEAATTEEQKILKIITAHQAEAFAKGVNPASLILPDGQTLADLLKGVSTFDISWWTADGGGKSSAGGTMEITGTIGQTDSATLSGGALVLNGGFWNESSLILVDNLETGDTSRWSTSVGSL